RRQLLPDLRHQLQCPGNHGPVRSEPVTAGISVDEYRRRWGSFPTAPVCHRHDSRRPAMDGSASAPLFRMEGVSKRYGGVNALTNADLTVEAGRIHGVLGENGAGKSTLMKIMAGVVQPDEGRMTL